MNTGHSSETAVRATYAQARQHPPETGAIVVLHLGDEESMLAFGKAAQPDQVSALPLGPQALGDRYFPAGRLNALAIEEAIAEVEDIVMPWHGKLPSAASLFMDAAEVAGLARWAGMPDNAGPWRLTTEAVEQLFNRWAALAQGRPASQDPLPTTARFSATLLVLREWLHHLGFDGITVVQRTPTAEAAQPGPARS